MEINKLLTPYNHRKGTIDRIKYIVIHYVGALSGAQSNCKYFMNDGRNASAHYFVDYDGSVWQSVEDKDIAWHCGGKNPTCNNNNSIGIEMCVRNDLQSLDDKNWYFEQATVDSTIALTRELMEKYHIPASNVWRHYDVTGKVCPAPYVYNNTRHTWEEFKRAISTQSKYEANKWYSDDVGWWYAKSTTEYARNEWLIINHHKYYFNDAGYAVKGQQSIYGAGYYFATAQESEQYECALMAIVEF